MAKEARREGSSKPGSEEKLVPKHEAQKGIAPAPEEKLLGEAETAKEKLLPPESDEELAKEYENMLKRLQAEFENYKKRVAKEKEERQLFEAEGTVLKLLPFLDDLDAALEAAAKSGDENLRNGVGALRDKLFALLAKEGLAEMRCEGEQFDPYRHEAILHEQSEKKEGTIVRVVRKGYLLRGKIIRHAIVTVSNGKKN